MDYKTEFIDGKEYFVICNSSELEEGRRLRAEIDIEYDFALFRIDGKVFCVSNVCPHKREAKMYKGYIEQEALICPMHGWSFSLETGKNTIGGKGIQVFNVLEESGKIFVEKAEKEKPKWMSNYSELGCE